MLWVNGKPIEKYHGKLKDGWQVKGVEITDISYSHMRNRSTLQYHATELGLKAITFSVDFTGPEEHMIALRKSLFDAEIHGKSELILPDGFMYSAVCTTLGEEVYHGREIIEAAYELSGIRHGPEEVVAGNRIFCESTLPKTDVILSVTVGKTGKNYRVGTVTFPSVTKGEKICVDGITKRILVGGVPAAQRAEWLEFPYLVPGWNNITCQDTVTAEFYPAYF